MKTLYPVAWDSNGKTNVFVAFTRQAALDFVAAEQREWENENAEYLEACGGADLPFAIDEIPLVDNYGFPCQIADTGFIAPWLGLVTLDEMRAYSPDYQARKDREYVREMSKSG